jgi:hypothetical protein
METNKTNEEKYPSVNLAYDIALKSYDAAMKRSDIADDGIDKLRSFVTTINLAFLAWVVSSNKTEPMLNAWFLVSLAIFLFSIILSIIAKSSNGIILPSPKELYNKYLHYSEWEFRKNFIYWSGEHYEKNKDMVANKAKYIVYIFILFLLEAAMMGYWLVKYVR